jgi:hypothetical protein
MVARKKRLYRTTSMKVWYSAVCDEHKEYCDVMVDSPCRTAWYLMPKNDDIQAWLMLHYGCSLRLIRHDHEYDELHEKGGYTNVKLTSWSLEKQAEWAKDLYEFLISKINK